mmetsp:Transcript_23291/g.72860  ORF Transcript_23291/g.72860 Transcript_23291/m.72860 type:complete len:104 (+) Transcript_23291:413-724(+)
MAFHADKRRALKDEVDAYDRKLGKMNRARGRHTPEQFARHKEKFRQATDAFYACDRNCERFLRYFSAAGHRVIEPELEARATPGQPTAGNPHPHAPLTSLSFS